MRRVVAQSLVSSAVLGLVLFGAAGTLAWAQGWLLLAIIAVFSLGTGAWLLRADPELLAERMRSPLAAGQRARDRLILLALFTAFCAWLAFMPLDARRFAWSGDPLWAQVAGAGLLIAGLAGFVAVLRANRFAATTIRVQPERGHIVIDTGPYAYVRHPMYGFAIPFLTGMPLLLGSLWGLFGVPLLVLLIALRAVEEEAVLRAGLPGYDAYAARVRSRLVPGVW